MFSNELFSGFGVELKQSEKDDLVSKFKAKFRRKFIKKDITTHGTIYNHFKYDVSWVELDEIELDSEERLIYVEIRKRSKLYLSNFPAFKKYLLTRGDGYYPAIYIFDRSLSGCLCENGERAALRPITLMHVIAEEDGNEEFK